MARPCSFGERDSVRHPPSTNANTQTETDRRRRDGQPHRPASPFCFRDTPAPASQNPLTGMSEHSPRRVLGRPPSASRGWLRRPHRRQRRPGQQQPTGRAGASDSRSCPRQRRRGDVTPSTASAILTKTAADENGAPLYVGERDSVRLSPVTNASTQTTQTRRRRDGTASQPASPSFLRTLPRRRRTRSCGTSVRLRPAQAGTATVRVTVGRLRRPHRPHANVAQVSSDQQCRALDLRFPSCPPATAAGRHAHHRLGLTKTAADEKRCAPVRG
jgi:hypothetical protein